MEKISRASSRIFDDCYTPFMTKFSIENFENVYHIAYVSDLAHMSSLLVSVTCGHIYFVQHFISSEKNKY